MIVEIDAREELLAAVIWYEEQREGLGAERERPCLAPPPSAGLAEVPSGEHVSPPAREPRARRRTPLLAALLADLHRRSFVWPPPPGTGPVQGTIGGPTDAGSD